MATFTNQAFLTYNGVTTSSNVVTGELQDELAITKTALSTTYSPSGDVTYIVSVVNSSATDYTGLTLTDNLGSYTYGQSALYPLSYTAGSIKLYLNGVLQPTPSVTAVSPLTVTGINIPSGANAQIIYQSSVTSYAPPATGGTVTNTAGLSGGNLVTPVSADYTINADAAPILEISKAISPSTVTEGGTIVYTFVIQNTGNAPAVAATAASITDTFEPVLQNLTASYNGTAWTAGTEYTYDTSTGSFVSTAGAITVPAATYTQNTTTGEWNVNPGIGTLVISGNI